MQGEIKNSYKILLSKPEGSRKLGRTTYGCDYNNKRDLTETGVTVWTGLKWFRITVSGENGDEPWHSITFTEYLGKLGDYQLLENSSCV